MKPYTDGNACASHIFSLLAFSSKLLLKDKGMVYKAVGSSTVEQQKHTKHLRQTIPSIV